MIDEKKLLNEMIDLLAKHCKDMQLTGKIVGLIDTQPTVQSQGIDKDRLISFLESYRDEYRSLFNTELEEKGFTGVAVITGIITWIEHHSTSDGWIPASERLPEENGKYFVTMWDEIIGPYTTEWHFYNGKFMPFIYHTNRKVLAWQPLPQPYKERE